MGTSHRHERRREQGEAQANGRLCQPRRNCLGMLPISPMLKQRTLPPQAVTAYHDSGCTWRSIVSKKNGEKSVTLVPSTVNKSRRRIDIVNDHPPLPTSADLSLLTAEGQVVYAARCSRRLQEVLKTAWSSAPDDFVDCVDAVVRTIEATARTRQKPTIALAARKLGNLFDLPIPSENYSIIASYVSAIYHAARCVLSPAERAEEAAMSAVDANCEPFLTPDAQMIAMHWAACTDFDRLRLLRSPLALLELPLWTEHRSLVASASSTESTKMEEYLAFCRGQFRQLRRKLNFEPMSDADHYINEVMSRFLEKRNAGEIKSNEHGYLYKCLYNCLIDELRHKSRHVQGDLHYLIDKTTSDNSGPHGADTRITEIRQALPEHYSILLDAYHNNSLDVTSRADRRTVENVLGITSTTQTTQFHRIRTGTYSKSRTQPATTFAELTNAQLVGPTSNPISPEMVAQLAEEPSPLLSEINEALNSETPLNGLSKHFDQHLEEFMRSIVDDEEALQKPRLRIYWKGRMQFRTGFLFAIALPVAFPRLFEMLDGFSFDRYKDYHAQVQKILVPMIPMLVRAFADEIGEFEQCELEEFVDEDLQEFQFAMAVQSLELAAQTFRTTEQWMWAGFAWAMLSHVWRCPLAWTSVTEDKPIDTAFVCAARAWGDFHLLSYATPGTNRLQDEWFLQVARDIEELCMSASIQVVENHSQTLQDAFDFLNRHDELFESHD